MKTSSAVRESIDRLDILAKSYPIKALAPEVKGAEHAKAESTLRAELNGQPGYKLGWGTAITIMALASDHHDHRVRAIAFDALDVVEAAFGRVAYQVPDHLHCGDPVPMMGHVARISKEFGDLVHTAADALADGRIDGPELDTFKRELNELIAACVQLKGLLDHMPVVARCRRIK